MHEVGQWILGAARRAMVPPHVEFDFGTRESVLMARLFDRPDGATITQLTELTGFAQSRVSTTVARLRSLGWVTTAHDPADGRRTVVRVASSTRRSIERVVMTPAGPAIDEILGWLPAQDRARVLEVLELLACHRPTAIKQAASRPRQRASRAGTRHEAHASGRLT